MIMELLASIEINLLHAYDMVASISLAGEKVISQGWDSVAVRCSK